MGGRQPARKEAALEKDPVTIHCDGRTLTCRADTTVAVALWEKGVRTLSHSPKYGSPRGVTCARGHCTACLMRVDGVPNVRTCELPVRAGMDIRHQDTGAAYGPLLQKVMAAGSSLLPVGFYYKWFTRPSFVSRGFLRAIRPLTGIGRLPDTAGSARSLPGAPAAGTLAASPGPARDLGRFDTVVVGGGPSGLAAARRASGSVLILDDHEQPGGQRAAALLAAGMDPGAGPGHFPCLREAKARLDTACAGWTAQASPGPPGVRFEGRTRAVAGYAPDLLLLRRGQDLLTARFRRFVWAAGALDTLGLFPGNDTPGVLGPRALYRLVARDGLDVQGRQVLVVGGGLDFWLSAALLAGRGARLTLMVTESGQEAEISAAVELKWSVHTGLALASVATVAGGSRLLAAFTAQNPAGGPLTSPLKVQADLAVICNRGKPAYDIPYQVGCGLLLQPELGGFVPAGAAGGSYQGTLPSGAAITVLGEAAGGLPGLPTSPGPEVDAG